jgi:hypothetical protein
LFPAIPIAEKFLRSCVILFFLFPSVLSAQTLAGIIDVHVHADPDSRARTMDVIDVAKLAKAQGMRGLVFKNHNESTVTAAYLVRKEVPGLEAFGSITLNLTVGGMNAAAVEEMASVKGGWGKVVCMPTEDSEYWVARSKQARAFVPVTHNGQLTSEVKKVLAVVAKRQLTLATGHISPEESLLLIREARSMGIDRIVVDQAMTVKMTLPQMQQAAKMGAYIEFVYDAVWDKRHTAQEYATAIRAIGPEHCILSSDLAQLGYPQSPDGFTDYIKILRGQGFKQSEIDQMAKTNPATLLGLS